MSPLRGDVPLLRLVHHAVGVRALRAALRAGAGLLGGRDLHQLRGDRDDRDRGLLRALDTLRAADERAVRHLDPVPAPVPPLVLPLQPELVAGAGVLPQSRAIT